MHQCVPAPAKMEPHQIARTQFQSCTQGAFPYNRIRPFIPDQNLAVKRARCHTAHRVLPHPPLISHHRTCIFVAPHQHPARQCLAAAAFHDLHNRLWKTESTKEMQKACREVLHSGHLAKQAIEVSGRALRQIWPAPRQRHEHRGQQEVCVRLPPAPLILSAACVAEPPSISTVCCHSRVQCRSEPFEQAGNAYNARAALQAGVHTLYGVGKA